VVSESEKIKRRAKCRNMPRYSEDSVFPAGAEKCPTLYGRVMLPKPAFNIRRGEGDERWRTGVSRKREDVKAHPAGLRKESRRILTERWRVSRRRTFYEGPSVVPSVRLSVLQPPDTGLTGILRESYDPRKDLSSHTRTRMSPLSA